MSPTYRRAVTAPSAHWPEVTSCLRRVTRPEPACGLATDASTTAPSSDPDGHPSQEIDRLRDELELVNSIQRAAVAEMDFQAIAELVGERLRDLLDVPTIGIEWFDDATGLMHVLYGHEEGRRLDPEPPHDRHLAGVAGTRPR